MSRKRTKKAATPTSSSSSSAHPIQQTPFTSTSTTSLSQATDGNRDGGSAAGSIMSKSAASALETTASVVHKVKAQVPETLQAVAQSVPQRLPQNLTRWTSTKSTPSTQIAQETAGRTLSFPGSSSKSQKSSSPMTKHLSPPRPTTQLTSLPKDTVDEAEEGENGQPTEAAMNGKDSTPNGVPKEDSSTDTSAAAAGTDPKTTSSGYWIPWWGSTQGTTSKVPEESEPAAKPVAAEAPPTLPTFPAIENIKADNKSLLKMRSVDNLGMKRKLNSSSASIKTAPPTLVDTSNLQATAEEPSGESTPLENSTEATQPTQQRSSWFGLWGSGQAPPTVDNGVKPTSEEITAETSVANPGETSQEASNAMDDTNETPGGISTEVASDVQPKVAAPDGILARGAAWVFWSKPQAQPDGTSSATETGEIAIAGSSSETAPQKAQVTTEPSQPAATTPRKKSSRKDLVRSPSSASLPSEQPPSIPVAPKDISPAAKTLQRVLPPNLLVPSFDSCFNPQQSATWLGTVSRLWSAPKAISRNQLYLTPIPPRIRKAVAIGVHGFFPMKLVQRVLGEPTGTSVRFATAGAAAIQRWAEQHNLSVDIEKIALEGEGMVADRVEVLWKLLENKLDVIQRADFILVCCHSQGTPVGVHLVARMIEYGIVDRTKIGIIGMAGINLGPFVELNSRILSGSAKELFDFSIPESLVSQEYLLSLTAVLAHGVKLVFVGSIDDQLVSLYSSTFSNISHPFIYRAVFVDGRVHAPDFISHVVGLALKLRNIGVRDHGIIRELSGPLAGSLYTGEGHSRIYDDAAIYDLGVRHALETSTKEFLRVPLKVEDFQLPSAANPYILPWAMRGMLEEKRVQGELQDEARTLLEEFAKWHPVSKQLKDVKFRLEAIRSKL